MRQLLISFFIGLSFSSMAEGLDTIEVSFNKTVILIFENEIINDEIGSDEVIFRREKNILKLAATEKNIDETNLFVETTDGYYTFIIVYNDNPKVLTHKFSSLKPTFEKSVSGVPIKQSPEEIKANTSKQAKALNIDQENQYIQDCQGISERPNNIHSVGIEAATLKFQLGSIFIKKDKLFFKIVIKNDSYIDYDIDILRFVIRAKKKVVKQTAGNIEILKPVFVFNEDIKKIKGKSGVVKVFVFDKFTFSDEKKLWVEIWEVNGERRIEFPITSDRILAVKKY